MAGIISYGAYIPRYRMNRKTIFNAVGFMGTFPSPGEKAVANWNEDSITMAVAAGLDCLCYAIGQCKSINSIALLAANSIPTPWPPASHPTIYRPSTGVFILGRLSPTWSSD